MKINEILDDYLFLTKNYGEAEISPLFVGGFDFDGQAVECQYICLTTRACKVYIYYEIFDEFAQLDFISTRTGIGKLIANEQLLTSNNTELIALYKWFDFNKENRHLAKKQKEIK